MQRVARGVAHAGTNVAPLAQALCRSTAVLAGLGLRGLASGDLQCSVAFVEQRPHRGPGMSNGGGAGPSTTAAAAEETPDEAAEGSAAHAPSCAIMFTGGREEEDLPAVSRFRSLASPR